MEVAVESELLAERYELRRTLGGGSSGVVWSAWDRHLREEVAVKVLRLQDPEHLHCLKTEFRTVAELRHRNLIEQYDLVIRGDRAFITMERVDGVSLLDALVGERTARTDRTPSSTLSLGTDALVAGATSDAVGPSLPRWPCPDPVAVKRLFRQLARGLVAIHAHGVVHRDLKPSNTLVTADGRVVVLDFGLTTQLTPFRPFGERSEQTIAGTFRYMAPEQARPGPLTPACDLYALGVMLYEVLARCLPFEGGLKDILQAKEAGLFVPPRELAPDIPADLEALVVELLDPTPAGRPSADETARRLGSVEASSTPAPLGAPFVGRQRELALLEGALARAEHEPHVAIVRGASGIGKSRLLRRFATRLREHPDLVLLSGRCRLDESLPFQAFDPIIDSLVRWLLRCAAYERAALLPRDASGLARVFPGLRRIQEFDRAAAGPSFTNRSLLFSRALQALRSLFRSLSRRGRVVILLDDAQWADPDSRRVLRELLRGTAAPPVLLVLAQRTGEGPERWLGGPEVQTTEVELQPVSPSEARELVVSLGIDEADAGPLVREGAGHPLFLRLLAEGGLAEGGLGASVRRRLARISPDARALLEVLALSPRAVPQPVASAAAGLTQSGSVVRELLAEQLARRVSRHSSALEPYHDRFAEEVRASLGPSRAATLHVALAQAWTGGDTSDDEATAHHWLAAARPEQAWAPLRRAAERAEEQLAFEAAARHRRRLLELVEHGDQPLEALQLALAEALELAGQRRNAGEVFAQAATGARGEERLELLRRAGEQYLRGGHVDEGLAVFGEVLQGVGVRLPDSRLAMLLQIGLPALVRSRDAGPAPIRADVTFSISSGLGLVDVLRGRLLQLHHARAVRRAPDPVRQARALAVEAGYLATRGASELPAARDMLDRARAVLGRDADPRLRGFVGAIEAVIAWCAGEWETTLEAAAGAISILDEAPGELAWERGFADSVRLDALLNLGRWAEMTEQSSRLVDEARRRGNLYIEATFTLRFGTMSCLAADRPDEALAGLEILRRWSQEGFHFQDLIELHNRAETYVYAGRAVEAAELVDARWGALRRSLLLVSQMFRITMLEMRGRVLVAASAESEGARARRFRRRARADAGRLDRLGTPWSRMNAALIRGGALAAQGEATAAAAEWRLGAERAERLSMSLHAGAMRWAAAELLGEDAVEARERFDQQGVVAPRKLRDLLCPGSRRD